MTRTIYALLVGIDDYPSPVNPPHWGNNHETENIDVHCCWQRSIAVALTRRLRRRSG